MCDEAVRLIARYSEVFAVSDLELSEFTAIEHHIETGEARSNKQCMRKNKRAVFQGEEEGLMDRMLAARVIQPSTSH